MTDNTGERFSDQEILIRGGRKKNKTGSAEETRCKKMFR